MDHLDIGYFALFTGLAFNEEVSRRLAEAGYGPLRQSHGFLVQHLVEVEHRPLGELVERMGITQQAVSKQVAELEALGMVARTVDPADARVRHVALTPRGREVIDATRAIRAQLVKELTKAVGRKKAEAARLVLAELLEALGGGEAVRARRVPPPQ